MNKHPHRAWATVAFRPRPKGLIPSIKINFIFKLLETRHFQKYWNYNIITTSVLWIFIIIRIHPLYKAVSIKLRLSPSKAGKVKVEYERERMLGIANKFINVLAIPSSLSRSYSTFPLNLLVDNLNWNSCMQVTLGEGFCRWKFRV
jgi:hypothetical protein